MATINLGRVGYVHRGAYDAQTVYQKMDVVFYDHGSYLYIGENASGHAPTDQAYWQAMLDPAEMNAATKAALEAAEKAAGAAGGDWEKLIPALTTSFTVSGEIVECYPVSNARLNVTTRFYPRQEGKGEASPSNIRPVQPETELAFVHVKNGNTESHVHQLVSPSYGGTFLWYNGMLAENGKYMILNGQELGSDWSGWRLQAGDTAAQRYFYINIEARKDLDAPDNVEEDGAIMSHFPNRPQIRTSNDIQGFRFYNVRDGYTAHARLVVRPDMADFIGGSDAETLQNWKNWLAGQEAQGTPVQIAYQMMTGVAKKESAGIEIRAGEGENIFQNNWGADILTVSGPLDPAYQNAQQDERIEALEEGAVSGGDSYTLPVATKETLGGVIVGDGLQVDADGRVSVEPEGVYELIETVTLAEDTAIERTQEPDGTPYDFVACQIKGESLGESAATNPANIYAWSNNMRVCATYSSAFTEVRKKYRHDCFEIDRGYWRSRWTDWASNPTAMAYVEDGSPRRLVYSTKDYPAINRVTTSAAIPAGTYEIWGVRANA